MGDTGIGDDGVAGKSGSRNVSSDFRPGARLACDGTSAMMASPVPTGITSPASPAYNRSSTASRGHTDLTSYTAAPGRPSARTCAAS